MSRVSFSGLPEPEDEVKLEENVLIAMSDGVRLAASLWRPKGEGKYPCILTYLPYHKDDFGRRTMEHLPYVFAERGYCYAVVDIRGTGASEGLCTEMYSLQEQKDGCEVVEWLASQPWSNGNVGMLGWSYGFSSTVLVAARNPPHLKAIVPFYGDVDLYDAMWEGGSFLGFHFGAWYASLMTAMNFMPPTFRDKEGRWVKISEERLQKNVPWFFNFLEHQTDDEFWRTKSIAYMYDKISVPTFTISGWNDIYPTWPNRLYMNVNVPKKAMLGPWLHQEPNKSAVGPRLDWYVIILKWFDYWLKGKDNGIMDEPPVLLYTAEYTPTDLLRHPTRAWMNGSWRREENLPIKRVEMTTFYLEKDRSLGRESPSVSGSERYDYDPTTGVYAGLIGGVYGPTTLPIDQRADEPSSIAFTTAPLGFDVEATGQPQTVLFISSSANVAAFSVKLCDVASDGSTVLVSRYYKNATRRESRSGPSPLRPGEVYELKVDMNYISYRFLKDHRIRLMISSADFPHLWPTPQLCTNTVYYGGEHPSRLILPVVPKLEGVPAVSLSSPDIPPLRERVIQPSDWRVHRDMTESSATVEWGRETEFSPDEETKMRQKWLVSATAHRYNPADTRVEGENLITVIKPGSIVETKARTVIQSDGNFFHATAELEIDYDRVPHTRERWSKTYPRKLC